MTPHLCYYPEDDDGWHHVECDCGWDSGPLPDMETAADVAGDHRVEMAMSPLVSALTAANDKLVDYLIATYGDPREHDDEWYETHEGPWMRAPELLLEARLLLANRATP